MDDTFIKHAVDMGYKGIVISNGKRKHSPQMYEGLNMLEKMGCSCYNF